ncbi:XRE family transcriptional regulator [Bifidobacterium pseudolongum PV8-2]|uniref:XRE family transcriptional regulator n=2 Tax=Bifidobacterium pseudolongum TaxID=1694 RepID=A0A0A7IC88_9BIFI|nr:XRE family transcriptional regulator [Bifidobacterium pseudolongum PV8-2]
MDCSPSEFKTLRRRARRQIDEDKALLQALVRQRKKMHVKQEELAFRMGITQPAVSAIETGNSSPSLSTLGRYANALGYIVTHAVQPDGEGWEPFAIQTQSESRGADETSRKMTAGYMAAQFVH